MKGLLMLGSVCLLLVLLVAQSSCERYHPKMAAKATTDDDDEAPMDDNDQMTDMDQGQDATPDDDDSNEDSSSGAAQVVDVVGNPVKDAANNLKNAKKPEEQEEEQKAGPDLNPINLSEEKERIKNELSKKGKKAPIQRAELEKNQKKAYDTFKQIMIRVLLISKISLQAAPVGHLVGIFIALLDTAVEAKGDVWSQIKGKVDAQIDKKLGRYHFDKTQGHFKKFQTLNKLKKNNFGLDDLVEVISAKHDMLPYNFRDIGYSEELATLLPTWAMFMVSAYQQLLANDKLPDQCALSRELTTLRADTIKSAKSLLKKRYKTIQGTGSAKHWPSYHCTGLPCGYTYHLKFKDSYSGKEKEDVLSDIDSFFKTIKEETVESLMKHMVEKINPYFTQDICGEGCECPTAITKDDIDFDYPKSCYGTAKDEAGGMCTLPCKSYSDGYPWCPYFSTGSGAWKFKDNKNRIGSNWSECTEPDWETCWAI